MVMTALVTVSGVERVMPLMTALIVVLPAATDVALPLLPLALLIVATPVADEDQVTLLVMSTLLEPSEKVPVAVYCCE